jgi:hypothetical protein
MRDTSMDELYKLCNYSFLKNHVALVVVGKLVGEIFDVALTSLLPAVGPALALRLLPHPPSTPCS